MDVTCNVIEDLLPLYADGICSEDSRTIVEHHTAVCSECKKKLEAMTAKIEPNESEKIPDQPKNPFKKLRFRYIRTVVIALCVCVVIAIPAIICTVLTINETLERNFSWSTIKLDRSLKKVGRMLENGEYRKALDAIIIPNLEGYSSAEALAFKDLLAEDLKDYFEQHPIEGFETYASYNNNIRLGDTVISSDINGYLHLEMKNESGLEYGAPVYEFLFKSTDMIIERGGFRYGIFDNFDLQWATDKAALDYYDNQERFLYYYWGSPDIAIVPADFSERYFQNLDTYDERNNITYYNTFFSYQFILENYSWEGTEFYETKDKAIEASQKFINEYAYYGCKTGRTEYIRDEIIIDIDRFCIQHVTLSFLKGGELITVDCDVPYSMKCYPYRLSAVRNIVYSDNAPEDFKTQFESIFAQ